MGNDHFVPQLLLRRFTSDGNRKTPIIEYELATGTFRLRPIRSVCAIDDLNSIDEVVIARAAASGMEFDTESLERGIGREIENPFANALQRIETNPDRLSGDDVDWLGSYVAFQLVRTPWAMGRHVEEADAEITYREVLARMLGEQPVVFDLIKERQWSLWQRAGDAGFYVVSDSPVQLMSRGGRNLPLTPEGLAARDGVLTMPLTKNLLVRAEFDAPGGVTLVADQEMVARYNYATTAGAVHHLYMPQKEFVIFDGARVRVVNEADPDTYRREVAE
ncbi:MAG: DUF4238 domain-containing protein [Coriobacteriia bacterium]|nr:DUF4238 domain-containing protein [Coriobacteriia bacterium]